MGRYLLPIVAFAVMVPIFIIGLSRDPSELPSPLLNRQAPVFELPSVEDPGRTVSNKSYAGEVAVVNIWATWCVGCRAEHDFLMTLASRNEVPIYGLNWRDQRDLALNWLDKLGNPYVATAYDEDGRVGIDWGVYGAPETFLIGPDGTVLYKHISPLTERVWREEFRPRIEAARGGSK